MTRKPSDAAITQALAPIRSRRAPPRHAYECGSSIPFAPSVGSKKPPSLEDRVRQLIKSREVARLAEESGRETFEEANDFDVEDFEGYDPPGSAYEMELDGIPLEDIRAQRAIEAQEQARIKAKASLPKKSKSASNPPPNPSNNTRSDNGASGSPRRERSDPQSSSKTKSTDDLVDILKRLGYGA